MNANKSGQAGAQTLLLGGAGAVLAFLVLILATSFASQINRSVQDQLSDVSSRSVTNETINGTGSINLNNSRISNTTVVVRNATQGVVAALNNWQMSSADADIGRINISGPYVNKALNVSYTYTHVIESIAYNASDNGRLGFDNVSSLFGPQGLLIMAAIVITTLIGMFMYRQFS